MRFLATFTLIVGFVCVNCACADFVTVFVAANNDDAEERIAGGAVFLLSSDLEVGNDNGLEQLIGLRFTNLGVPANAIVSSAHLTFRARGDSSGAASFVIAGESAPNGTGFLANNFDLSSRTTTSNSVFWSPSDWLGEQAYQSADIGSIVQEMIDQGGWSPGNAMNFFVSNDVGNTGFRRAWSFDGASGSAASLWIEYSTVPEPATGLLSGLVLGMSLISRRRRR